MNEQPVSPRKDASMDLLNDILRNPIDPDYQIVAQRKGLSPRSPRVVIALIAVVIGTMFSLSAVETTRSAPVAAQEREGLIRQVQELDREQDRLRAEIEQLRKDNAEVRGNLLSGSEDAAATQAEINRLAPRAGEVPVTGPGLIITVDDAPAVRDDKLNRVLDNDLQMLVNGLWSAGAEAIAVNGHRVSTLTAVRSAGDAITVNYRSLTRPYRVEVIGNPQTLAARFADSHGGQLWQGLAQNYQMRFDVGTSERLTLRADPSLALTHARRVA